MDQPNKLDGLLESLRIEEDDEEDGIPTSGILIYETMCEDRSHTLNMLFSSGASVFHILGLLESAITFFKADIARDE